jgi:predicted neutral ceramidase superfamily lipid hydrolase
LWDLRQAAAFVTLAPLFVVDILKMSSKLVIAAILFMMVAPPIVLYVWGVLDEVLTGNFHIVPVIIAAVLACVFVAAAYAFGRVVRRTEQRG